MDRLTGWDKENAYNLKCFEGEIGCEDMDTSKCDYCEHAQAIYQRLAAYEDCGTLEQVQEWAEAFAEDVCEKCAYYWRAARDEPCDKCTHGSLVEDCYEPAEKERGDEVL